MGKLHEIVIPGIYRINLPVPCLPSSNVYVICDDGITLIDAGHVTAAAQEKLREGLAEVGISPADVTGVFLTDVTPDRIGGVLDGGLFDHAEVIAHPGAGKAALDYTAYSLAFRRELVSPTFRDRRLLKRTDLSDLDKALQLAYKAQGRIGFGKVAVPAGSMSIGRRRVYPIAAPAGTANHMAYWLEPDGVIFSGTFGQDDGRSVPVLIEGLGATWKAYRNAAACLESYRSRKLLPASGEPAQGGEMILRRAAKVAEQVRENLRALVVAGPREFATLCDYMSLGHGLGSLRAVQQTATYATILDDLVSEEEMEAIYEERTLTYRLAINSLKPVRKRA